jgi:hypothetical protein
MIQTIYEQYVYNKGYSPLLQIYSHTSTAAVRIANTGFWTETSWFLVWITEGPKTTRVGFTRIAPFHTASDGVGALQKAWQACAFSKSIAQEGTLSVRTTGRWITGIRW